jgi:hypothetical protein
VGHLTTTGRERKNRLEGVSWKQLREEDRFEDLGVDGRLMIK